MLRFDHISRLLSCNVKTDLALEEIERALDDQTIRDLQTLSDAASKWTKSMVDDLLKSDFLIREPETCTETVLRETIFKATNPCIVELGVEMNIKVKVAPQCSKRLIPSPPPRMEEIPESTQKQIMDPASSTNEDFSDEDEGPIDLSVPPTPPPTPVDSDAVSTSKDLIDG